MVLIEYNFISVHVVKKKINLSRWLWDIDNNKDHQSDKANVNVIQDKMYKSGIFIEVNLSHYFFMNTYFGYKAKSHSTFSCTVVFYVFESKRLHHTYSVCCTI